MIVKRHWFAFAAQPAVYGVERGDARSVSLVGGQGADGGGVFKKQGNVFDVADILVGHDGVRIVKMKGIVEMVFVAKHGENQHKDRQGPERRRFEVSG